MLIYIELFVVTHTIAILFLLSSPPYKIIKCKQLAILQRERGTKNASYNLQSYKEKEAIPQLDIQIIPQLDIQIIPQLDIQIITMFLPKFTQLYS